MKTIAAATLLAAIAGFATNARADHGRVDVGITFGSPAPATVYAHAPVYAPTPVYAPAYTPEVRGHWEDVTTKTWIPGRWIETRNHWGRPVRVFENGHLEYRTDRVWVEAPRHEYGNYGYGDRDYRNRYDGRSWNR